MSAQTTYSFSAQMGSAGGIVDLAPYVIDAFHNEENSGVLKLGMGVVPGVGANGVKLPTNASASGDFLGVVVNGRTTEYDLEGYANIRKGATVGVMRYGRIYVRVKSGVTVAAGDPVYLINTGTYAGQFANVDTDAVAVAGKFIGASDSNGIAPVHLFDAPAPAAPAEANEG